jgi:error-prone DNA polymerase
MQIAMVAAGFTAGQADNLRRAMGRFRNDGDLEPFREKLLSGMRERGYSDAFALNIYEQVKGFGSYGFPESHAASFAILAYYSAWLKRHKPAAFLAGMINSQPLGFYSSAQLIRDAQAHQVDVRAIDVRYSEWDCTLEANADTPIAVRLGLRLIKGLSQTTADQIVARRNEHSFQSWQDFIERCNITQSDLQLLASANALQALSGHRYYAKWQADGSQFDGELWQHPRINEAAPILQKPNAWQDLVQDVASTRVSLNNHPIGFFRAQLRLKNVHLLSSIAQIKTGYVINIAGLVTNRQRPGTANGVTFLTLEDETGQANIIVWSQVLERYRQAVVFGSLLLIEGQLQREGEVIHIVTRRVEDLSHWQGDLVTTSRDFH